MQIDLRLLRHALALAEHRSFSRAADALNSSQPTLSRSIKELEGRVGLPLFTRDRAGVEPTDFGLVFLEQAADLIARAGDLQREVELAKGLQTGEVAIGLGPYALDALAPVFAPRFAAAYPAVQLRVTMDAPQLIARQLRARAIDIAVADSGILGDAEDLEVLAKLLPVPGYVVVRAGHPLAGKARVDFGDLLDFPFAQVTMLPPRVLKPILALRSASRAGVPALPFPAIDCRTARLAVSIVAGSDAFTFSPLGLVRQEIEQHVLVPVLQPPWLRAEWSVVRLRRRTMSPAMLALVAELQRAHADVLRVETLLGEQWRAHSAVAARRRSRRKA